MSSNLYETPESDLGVAETQATSFYVVSPKKFLILFVGTVGMYQLYWFYKNWKCYSESSQEKLRPFWRAIFMVFYIHAFYKLLGEKITKADETYEWKAGFFALIGIIAIVMAAIASQLSLREVGSPLTDVFGTIVFPAIAGWTMFQAQKVGNLLCGDPLGKQNDLLTVLNYFWLALGAIYYALFAALLLGIFDVEPTT